MTQCAWNIVADIGGTNARFAVAEKQTGALHCVSRYTVAEHTHFSDALVQFMTDVKLSERWAPGPDAACFALACPVSGERIRFTNSPWHIDRHEIRELLGSASVTLINDFAAVGYGVTELTVDDWVDVSAGVAVPDAPIVVLGPGTGLGVCTVVPNGSSFQVLAGEGGHVDFCAVDETDIQVLQYLMARFDRVSVERVLSGSGIENIYQALSACAGKPPLLQSAADIAAAATEGSDSLAVDTLDLFCRCLGSVAGNLALTLGARGGIYIAGGIVPRFVDFFLASGFRRRFLAKGRFEAYLSEIPVRLILKQDLGLVGAAKRLSLLVH